MKKTVRINELLSYPNRRYAIREQKAELLYRNEEFLSDLAKMEPFFVLVHRGRDFKKYLKELRAKTPEGEGVQIDQARDLFMEKNLADLGLEKPPDWQWFYEKWNIVPHWQGEKAKLWVFIQAGPSLYTRVSQGGQRYKYAHLEMNSGFEQNRDEPFPIPDISIAVDPWTTRKEIVRLCKILPEQIESVFGFVMDTRGCFARDLCWYDLNRELDLTPAQIAKLWAKKRPNDLLEMISGNEDPDDELPYIVRAAIDRLQDAVDYLSITPAFGDGGNR